MDRMFALVPAAGTGSRMGEGPPKQYLPLAGRAMIHHTLWSLMRARRIERVFVVLAPDDPEWDGLDWSAFGDRLVSLRCGGASRAESVRNGLAAAPGVEDDDWVLVHDAARPCLPLEALERLVATLSGDAVGGLLAVRAADTLKRGDADDRVVETVPRQHIWHAQTPQMFRRGLLLRAIDYAGPAATDEASAVEALGLKPLLVEGDSRNLKVTFPGDLALAELLLKNMESAERL
jgi:2-C-methyl-D-erythritol 4-phosphate cytidylyltransferase